MATTKIGAGVVDLNSDNTSFKMPVGSSSFTGTPVAGMIRNNSSISNGIAQTTLISKTIPDHDRNHPILAAPENKL